MGHVEDSLFNGSCSPPDIEILFLGDSITIFRVYTSRKSSALLSGPGMLSRRTSYS